MPAAIRIHRRLRIRPVTAHVREPEVRVPRRVHVVARRAPAVHGVRRGVPVRGGPVGVRLGGRGVRVRVRLRRGVDVVAVAAAARVGAAAVVVVVVVYEDGRGHALGFFGDFAVEAFCPPPPYSSRHEREYDPRDEEPDDRERGCDCAFVLEESLRRSTHRPTRRRRRRRPRQRIRLKLRMRHDAPIRRRRERHAGGDARARARAREAARRAGEAACGRAGGGRAGCAGGEGAGGGDRARAGRRGA
ncbi:hypothetical protein B0H12DRAFT_1142013 [Mycena haematopus]|nr:hypothetical protein B0H12DRAFT_1142013 [Mycena haematopus]